MPDLLLPNLLPEGSIVADEHSGTVAYAVEQLRAYDERLSLVRNLKEGQWEIWRHNEDHSDSRVGFWKSDSIPDGRQMVEHLAKHDTRRGYDPIADLVAKEEARKREREADARDELDDLHDKLHWGLAQDLSAHAPAARPIFVNDHPASA